MIRRLNVKNFRSLKNFEIEFKKFNVLIGRNNVGKSNIIDAIRFIGEGFSENLESLFNKRGGYKNVVFGRNDENDIEIEIESEEDNFTFFYYVRISGKYEQIRVVDEKFKIKNKSLEKLLRLKGYKDDFMDGFEFGYSDVYHLMPKLFGRGLLRHIPEENKIFSQIDLSIKESVKKDNKEVLIKPFYNLPFLYNFWIQSQPTRHATSTDIFLSICKKENYNKFLNKESYSLFIPTSYNVDDIAKIIEIGLKGIDKFFNTVKISTYNFDPYIIKKEIPDAFVEKPVVLKRDGNNLSTVLLNLLQEDRKKFDRIQELLSGIIEEIEEIRPAVEGNKVYLKIKEKKFDNDFLAWTIADGTISLLAHITAIHTANDNRTICFEEPENYIHMRLLEFIFDLLKNTEKQIIISTHSPYFVDYCGPEDLIIIEKEKGETKARKIENIKKFKKILEEEGLTLGEIYYSSELKK